MPGGIERLGWDAGRLAAYQRGRLRALLARAAGHSPFHEYAEFTMSVARPMAAAMAAGWPPREGLRVAMVGAASPVHSSGLAAAVADGPPVHIIPAPVTLPLAEIVARLNAAGAPALLGYPTMLRQLAGEGGGTGHGHLRAKPQ